MIVTTIARVARTIGADGREVRSRSLARRGMLHSECESIDHLGLDPGARASSQGTEGTEGAWLLVRGSALLATGTGEPETAVVLKPGDLVLTKMNSEVEISGGPEGAELVWCQLLSRDVTDALPRRRPRM